VKKNIDKEKIRNSQIHIASSRPQGIKVQTQYRIKTRVDEPIQSENEESQDRKGGNRKPIFRMSKVDPFDGAFPPSHHASTVMNSSNINSQLLP